MKKINLLTLITLLLIASFSLGACSKAVSLPGTINDSAVETEENTDVAEQIKPTSEVSNDDDLDTLADEIDETLILDEDFSDLE